MEPLTFSYIEKGKSGAPIVHSLRMDDRVIVHSITVNRTPALPRTHRSLGATAMPAKEREWKNATNAVTGRTVTLARTNPCCCG